MFQIWLKAETSQVSQAEILSTNVHIHMNNYGELKCTATDLWSSIRHTNHILLIPVTMWILDLKIAKQKKTQVPLLIEIHGIWYFWPNELDMMGCKKANVIIIIIII